LTTSAGPLPKAPAAQITNVCSDTNHNKFSLLKEFKGVNSNFIRHSCGGFSPPFHGGLFLLD
jgi:hypothetical protein